MDDKQSRRKLALGRILGVILGFALVSIVDGIVIHSTGISISRHLAAVIRQVFSLPVR